MDYIPQQFIEQAVPLTIGAFHETETLYGTLVC